MRVILKLNAAGEFVGGATGDDDENFVAWIGANGELVLSEAERDGDTLNFSGTVYVSQPAVKTDEGWSFEFEELGVIRLRMTKTADGRTYLGSGKATPKKATGEAIRRMFFGETAPVKSKKSRVAETLDAD